jgi:hypothetical protein
VLTLPPVSELPKIPTQKADQLPLPKLPRTKKGTKKSLTKSTAELPPVMALPPVIDSPNIPSKNSNVIPVPKLAETKKAKTKGLTKTTNSLEIPAF